MGGSGLNHFPSSRFPQLGGLPSGTLPGLPVPDFLLPPSAVIAWGGGVPRGCPESSALHLRTPRTAPTAPSSSAGWQSRFAGTCPERRKWPHRKLTHPHPDALPFSARGCPPPPYLSQPPLLSLGVSHSPVIHHPSHFWGLGRGPSTHLAPYFV